MKKKDNSKFLSMIFGEISSPFSKYFDARHNPRRQISEVDTMQKFHDHLS